jgi:hypothetical protein
MRKSYRVDFHSNQDYHIRPLLESILESHPDIIGSYREYEELPLRQILEETRDAKDPDDIDDFSLYLIVQGFEIGILSINADDPEYYELGDRSHIGMSCYVEEAEEPRFLQVVDSIVAVIEDAIKSLDIPYEKEIYGHVDLVLAAR